MTEEERDEYRLEEERERDLWQQRQYEARQLEAYIVAVMASEPGKSIWS